MFEQTFKNIDDILHKDAGCGSELDYVEQTSWVLFLKYVDDLEKEKKILDDQGIIHSIRNVSDLDEAPSSYKDVEIVMENQKDLVDIVDRLTPLGVVKG